MENEGDGGISLILLCNGYTAFETFFFFVTVSTLKAGLSFHDVYVY